MKQTIECVRKMLTAGLSREERTELSKTDSVSGHLYSVWRQTEDEIDQNIEQRMWKRIERMCWGAPKTQILRNTIFRLVSAAAVITLLLVSGYWWMGKDDVKYLTISTNEDQILSLTLPDSSIVWLNSGTSIRYPEQFNTDRRVMLTGEAFFDVQKNEGHPFTVDLADASIEVKGTVFNVRSLKDQAVEVALLAGSIDFSLKDKPEHISLKPTETICYDCKNGELQHSKTNFSFFDWRTNIYRFKDKQLSDLVDMICQIYQVRVIIDKNYYKNNLFTGSIRKDESLTDVVDKICISLNLKYRMENNEIKLY